MFKPYLRLIALACLTLSIVLGMLLLPFAAIAVPVSAQQTSTTPEAQASDQSNNVVVLSQVQNPDGTTTVTTRIYATPNEPNAPNTNFWLSQDTYIASNYPNNNYGSASNLGIGYNSGGPGAMRMLLQFNLSNIPANATVNSAMVYLYQYAASGISSMGFQAQYAVASWNEYNATWNNANFIGGAALPVGYFPNTLGWLAIPSTNLFRSWVNGQEPNYGLIITGNEDPVANSSRYFYSSGTSQRPYVDISYTTGCAYTTPPTSYVNGLPATSPNVFTVSWTGTAYTPPGCTANGIASYIVWYQVNGGGFIKWLDGVSYTSATFNAASLGIGNGAVVAFRSQAIDYYGNKTPAGNATASTTISVIEPTAYLNALPTWTTTTPFQVSWGGNAQGGPAITSYNFEVNVNNGGWSRLLTNTPQTSYQYSGANGSNYQFRVQASNNNGASFGPWSAVASTSVDNAPPTSTMNSLPQYTTATEFWVSWSGTDSASGVASYNLQYQLDGGSWVTLINNTPQTSFLMQNAQTGKYGFRVQAVDYAGNVQPWPSSAQASTTVLVNPLALIKPFTPALIKSAPPVSFTVSWQGYAPPGTMLTGYTVKYRYNSGTWQTMGTYPAIQTSDIFTATAVGTYQFQATATNDAGTPSVELPEAYWQTMFVTPNGSVTYLPRIANNAQ
ncbi:MAG TPA: DNRLRE domain-containing protein [Anaerolineae bacterium]|nr:DNRLRE domain-containing protein [Anaerolineae bacterium]